MLHSPIDCNNVDDYQLKQENRIGALSRYRFVFAPIMGLLTTLLMTVFVGYHAVFTSLLGGIVGIGVLLVLPSPQKSPSKNPSIIRLDRDTTS